MVIQERGSSYADDSDYAEKAEPLAGWQHTANDPVPQLPTAALKRLASNDSDGQRDFLRGDSPIWPLYINGALENAHVSAELWRTNLDALLVFAGLFAGVVASFVIDSRQDLLSDSEGSILEGILKVIRNEPAGEFELDLLAVWINGLWVFSLILTLFTAIVGGIAKSWLVKFGTCLSRQDSDHAYQRWLLDTRRLHLERTIAIVPCILHLALVFFGVAFALECLHDHEMIGRLMLIAVSLGIAAYGVWTIGAMWNSEHPLPLNTPLSDLVIGLKQLIIGRLSHAPKIDWAKPEGPPFPESLQYNFKDHVLASICGKLLSSPDRQSVDEAITEIVQLSNDDWLVYFINYKVADVCIKRIQEFIPYSATYHQEEPITRDQILRLHLKALLYLWSWSERKNETEISLSLRRKLQHHLEPERPFGHWNVLPEPLRPLTFSLRIAMHLNLERDFSREEMDERSWETIALHSNQHKQRLSFAMAACRAIASKSHLPNLQGVSTLSICLNIIKAAQTDSESEWTENPGIRGYREESLNKSEDCIHHLLRQLESLWRSTFVEHLKKAVLDDPESPENGSTRVSFPLSTLLQMVLYDTDKSAHETSIRCLRLLGEVEVSDDEVSEIPGVLSSHHTSINHGSLKEVISKLSRYLQNDTFRNKMEACLKDSINTKSLDAMTYALQRLPIFFENDLIRNRIDFLSEIVIPLTVSEKGSDFRNAARLALKSCIESVSDKDMSILKAHALKTLQPIFDGTELGTYLFDIFAELEDLQSCGIGDIILNCIPNAVEVTRKCGVNDKHQKRMAGILESWSQLQHNAKIVDRLIECFDGFQQLFDTRSADLRIQWLDILRGFAEQGPLPKVIEELINASLNDPDSNVRSKGVGILLAVLCTPHWQDNATVKTVQNHLTNALHLEVAVDTSGEDRTVDQIEALRNASFDMLATLIQCPPYSALLLNKYREAIGTEIYEILARQSKARSENGGDELPNMEAFPQHLQSLGSSKKPNDRVLFIRILCICNSTDQQVSPYNVIFHLLPFTSPDNESRVKIAAIKAIGNIITQEAKRAGASEFEARPAAPQFPPVVPPLLKLARDGDADVRACVISVLSQVSEPDVFKSEQKLLKQIKKDKSSSVQSAWANSKFATPQQLVNIALKGSHHEDVHKAAHRHITEMIAKSLDTKTIIASIIPLLRTPESPFCHRAFRILQLFIANPKPSQRDVSNIIKPEIRHVLAAAVGGDNVAVNEIAGQIFHQLCDWKSPEINAAIILALPRVVDSMDNKGKAMMAVFLDRLEVSTHDYTLAVPDIARVLEDGHWYSKQIVMEGLLKFCCKCESGNAPTTFMKALLDSVAQLALHDKDEGVRQRCIRLLIQLLRQDESLHSNKLRGYRSRFMSLLEVKSLRSFAAELISLLCINPNSRRNVAKWMLASVAESQEGHLEGVAELLSRLILDKRLKVYDSCVNNRDSLSPGETNASPTARYERALALDYALLLLASVLMMRPSLSAYRFRFASGLLGNYHRDFAPDYNGQQNIPDTLKKWLLFMVFGHHVTKAEVNEWLSKPPPEPVSPNTPITQAI